jgi:hypothetical protein
MERYRKDLDTFVDSLSEKGKEILLLMETEDGKKIGEIIPDVASIEADDKKRDLMHKFLKVDDDEAYL